MNRTQALAYVSFCVDDARAERTNYKIPANARLVGWQCGFEPLFVAVWSYLDSDDEDGGIDMAEAEELATDLLVEKRWFADNENPPAADYVF